MISFINVKIILRVLIVDRNAMTFVAVRAFALELRRFINVKQIQAAIRLTAMRETR